jgi:hypothetical protein
VLSKEVGHDIADAGVVVDHQDAGARAGHIEDLLHGGDVAGAA